ncbi:MAG: hypothetical protein KF901_28975 [Myxococcales bacterium]|nr:hypothetical protein [Myxococcales bacterium]
MRPTLALPALLSLACATGTTQAPLEPGDETRSSGGEHAETSEAPTSAAPQPEALQCLGVGTMDVVVSREHYATRTGHGRTRFSELMTSHAKPLEECGLEAVLLTLARLKCEDGSNPYGGDLRTAHRSRRGNVGPGGRCESIIDLYAAPCPEGVYEVYADMYFCPRD